MAHRLDAVSTLIRAGRYDEALQGAAAAVELDPSHERARATLGWALFLGGRREEGLAELERAAASAPGSTLWLGQLGQAYAMAGRQERARDVLRELEARAGNGFVSPSTSPTYTPVSARPIGRSTAWSAPWPSGRVRSTG